MISKITKTCIILSPYFPPSTLAGVHRARHLAKGLPAHGWRPVVVRADPRGYHEPGDSALAALVSPDLLQLYTQTLTVQLTRRFGFRDIGLRGFRGFACSLRKAAQEHKADVVLITGSPFYPMLLARMVQHEIGLPVVLDFQDPWISRDGALRPRCSKAWLSHQLAVALEPRALRHAAFVTSVSEVQNREMSARYPWLDAERMAAIPIGGDPDDFEALRNAPSANTVHRLDPEKINLSYVGNVWIRAEPVVKGVFRAIRRFCDANPRLEERLKLNFVGTSNQPGATGEGRAIALAREEGVAHLVAETAQRVPYLEALSILANSQGLLMIGSDEPHYTASKIYPCLMSGRPYLSVFHAASSAHAILTAAGGGRTFAIRGIDDLQALEPAIAEALGDLCERPETFGLANPVAYAPFTAEGVARDFARVFETVARNS